MSNWFAARWGTFVESFDPEEVSSGSSPVAVLIAPGGFAVVFAVIGYVPAVRELAQFGQPNVSLALVVVGCIFSVLVWRTRAKGTLGALGTLMDTSCYSAAVCWAALHSTGGFAIGFAVVEALAAVMVVAQVYALSLLIVIALWLPALAMMLTLREPHPAASIILACASIMSVFTMYFTTKRRELQRGAQRLQTALGAADQVLDATMQRALTTTLLNLGNFVHELRNAQTAVRLNLEFLKDQSELSHDLQETIRDALDAARTEQALIQDTIEGIRSQINSPAKTLVLQDVLRSSIASEAPEIEVVLAEPPSLAFEVAGEPAHLNAVFRNLFRNARQAGATCVEVDINPEPNGAAMAIVVRDNGRGIPPARLPTLFNAVFASDKASGTGFGLYLSRRYIELMHGSIDAENTESGAQFRIRLPGRFVSNELDRSSFPSTSA